MSGTYKVMMGDRGRLVVPAPVREEAGLSEGTPLMLMATPSGIVVMTREQLKARVRAELAGTDLVDALLAERRIVAADEGAA
ncbi:MAG: AbrB/MazE/SpoVT family DNA-binding domain-containing protein [Acidimicrobiia bacterium]|nr:AbrB/MazE/SpoVT family DNA-binding domain-containing protein [Acidimicrobiia bacterium]